MSTPLGADIARVDGRAKVTGTARYTADHRTRNTAFAYVVQSTVARGRVRSMNVDAAHESPGVIAVYTPFDAPRVYSSDGYGENYAALQDAEVRFHGQVIGVVVAETFEQARHAATLVTTDYEVRDARLSLADARPGTPMEVEDTGAPAVTRPVLQPGMPSIEEALHRSPVTVDVSVTQHAQCHVAMEPHATTAVWDHGQLTVYGSTQIPAVHARTLAQRVGVPPERVRVVSPFVGGGFGGRVPTWSEAYLAAVVARELDRPVRLALTREQVFSLAGHRPMLEQRVRLGASADGTLQAVSHQTLTEMPAVGGWQELPASETTAVLYRTPNLALDQRQAVLDTPSSWAMRAPNESPGAFALETAMDELAAALRLDPVELRLRNYATTVPGTDRPWTAKRLDECYRVGAERFGWSDRNPVPRSRIDGEWLIGSGMATAIYPANRSDVSIRMSLRANGIAHVAAATPDLGTGTYTMVSIVASDTLGIPVDHVTAELGDSALPPGAPAVGSQAAGSLAPVIQATGRRLIDALRDLAVRTPRSPFHGADPAGLAYRDGRIEGPDGRSVPFGELISMAGRPSLDVTSPAGGEEPGTSGPEAHSFGAHFCEVRVNRFTGETRVARFVTVADVGQVLSARTARSQLLGGVVFGIGSALLESNPLEDTGRYASSSMADYLVAVNADIPEIDISWIDYTDTDFSTAGARGMGELGAVGSSAAIANAVFNATGIRVRDLPITLDKLIQAS